ncbi:solute carrier family 49 member 4-like isoform X2 [Ostrea edulis]|uniref:solute carrier family 49 member 4-like isoform X2 n=1 Tax=Ostrea edulis TaxID=37623 RepID=UPI0024AFFA68|nr:solute carrier family 49 member 4-like isoform X2 [Ostrea edulis]
MMDLHREKQEDETNIYKRRWYILLLFSLLAMTQGAYWNTWGPIAESSEDAFHWEDSDIALFENWGPIGYLVAGFFSAWLADVKGLRFSCVLAAFLVAAGAGIRCITSEHPYVTWTANIGQALNGFAGPIAMGAPPLVSAVWFPVHERTTATSISSGFNLLGIAISFIIGPRIVETSPSSSKEENRGNLSSAPEYIHNDSSTLTTGLHQMNNFTFTSDQRRIQEEQEQIMLLMYVECAWAVLLFVVMLIYFPNKPKIPPTKTAAIPRIEFKNGLKKIIRIREFWIIAAIYSISMGVFNVWQGIFDVYLKPHGFSQDQVAWLGASAICAGFVSSIVISRFADIFSRHHRFFLIGLYVVGGLAFLWFILLVEDILPDSEVSLYVSIILGTMCLQASTPLYFEMGCEVCYPVAEGLTNVLLTLLANVISFVFLLLQMIPKIGEMI